MSRHCEKGCLGHSLCAALLSPTPTPSTGYPSKLRQNGAPSCSLLPVLQEQGEFFFIRIISRNIVILTSLLHFRDEIPSAALLRGGLSDYESQTSEDNIILTPPPAVPQVSV